MKKFLLSIQLGLLVLLTSNSYAQTITTFAGNGSYGYSGDNGPATAAMFNHICGIAVDTAGNLFIPDYNNNVIRKVTPAGIITTIAGTSTAGYSGDGGPATAAELNTPWGIKIDKTGNIFFVEHGNDIVRKINPAGIITTFAGNTIISYSGDGGQATDATLYYPGDVAVDDTGNVYIADGGNHVVRKVDTTGVITTFAGTGTAGYNGDGLLASNAQLNNPFYLAWGKNGSLYISDNVNNRIRMVNSSGIISTVVGDGTAGNGGDGGPATAAQINGQVGLTLDSAGNMYLSLGSNDVIRKVTGTTISTIAGNGISGYSGDGGNPLLAELDYPCGIAVDKTNHIFIADANNNVIRKVFELTTGINNVNLIDNNLKIYPNPANTGFTITSTEKINSVSINNFLGQIVYAHEYNAEKVQVDISTLPVGMYFIKINGLDVKELVKE